MSVAFTEEHEHILSILFYLFIRHIYYHRQNVQLKTDIIRMPGHLKSMPKIIKHYSKNIYNYIKHYQYNRMFGNNKNLKCVSIAETINTCFRI